MRDQVKAITTLGTIPISSDDLVAQLLEFIRAKFYPKHPVNFAKDRPRLLKWVVLYPAAWLDARGVTLPPDRYRQILLHILQDALRFGHTGHITYLPAYLKMVIQAHFAHHGEEYYDEGKSIRAKTDAVLLSLSTARRVSPAPPDPVRELAQAARLVRAPNRRRPPPVKGQLTLL